MEERDLPFILSHFGDLDVTEYMVDNEPITSLKDAQGILEWSYGNPVNPTNNRWLITLEGKAIGTIGYHRIDKNNHIAEIGYDLSKEYWRKGYMNEAMDAVIRFGFKEINLNRIQAFVHVENVPSYKILRKFGFVPEGILRDMYFFRNQYHDHHILSLLKRDWNNEYYN